MDMDQTTQLKRNISPIIMIMIKHKIRLCVCVFDDLNVRIKRQYF